MEVMLIHMKWWWLSLFCAFSLAGSAQFSDCATALSVCNNIYTEDNSPAGTGQVFEVGPGSCQTGGEFNSAWYVFTPQSDGFLSFVLEPNSALDDYDWSLFDITENGCAGINSGVSPEVSCNSYGNVGIEQGPTGISSALGGAGNSNGPGNTFGPPFNADLPVTSGQLYALVVMNYSATLNGYTLDFSQSEVSVFDETPPSVVGVSTDCNQTFLTVQMSEAVNTNELNTFNINLVANGVTLNIQSVVVQGADFVDSFVLEGTSFAGVVGEVTLSFGDPLVDACGNASDSPFVFTLLGEVNLQADIVPACAGEGGGLEVLLGGGPDGCFTFDLDGILPTSAACRSGEFVGVEPGVYTLTVVSEDELCTAVALVEVGEVNLVVDAGDDVSFCDLSGSLSGSSSGGVVTWTGPAGVNFSSPSITSTNVSSETEGTFGLVITATLNGCSVSDEVIVTFNPPPTVELSVTDATCFDFCDGMLVLQNQASVTAIVGGDSKTGTNLEWDGLCRSSGTLTVIFSPGCQAFYDFQIGSLPELLAAPLAIPPVAPLERPEFLLEANIEQADSWVWSIPQFPDSTSMDHDWSLVLPKVPGEVEVWLTLANIAGCSRLYRLNLMVLDEFFVYVPTAFTPDNDGVNDVFVPRFSFLPKRYEWSIFNRWGVEVFRTNDPMQWWLGEAGEENSYAPNDCYNWRMSVQIDAENTRVYSGIVHQIR
jgi:hypothetical protein